MLRSPFIALPSDTIRGPRCSRLPTGFRSSALGNMLNDLPRTMRLSRCLLRLRDYSGLTMILVEQNLDFIAALSKRILIIQKGIITREVQPSDLGDASLVGE